MATLIYALLVCLALASPAAAQTSRADAIAREQAAKAAQLSEEGPSHMEQVIRRVLLSPLLSGGDGAYPWFGSVFSGTGMGAGAGFFKRLEHGASFNGQAGISINNSKTVRGAFNPPELWRGMLRLDVSGQWLDAHDVSFYGLGPQSDEHARERFDFSPKEVRTSVTLRPRRIVSMAGSYAFINFDSTRDQPHFSAAEAPGLDRELNFHVTRGTLSIDTRPAAAYSTRGGYLKASVERNQEARGLPYSFTLQEYEAAHEVPLVREQFVLAARALVTLTTPDSGDAVPVMLAPYLGSGSTLRGYANRRFLDQNRALMTGEYRWRPSRYLDMALFLDAGQVAPDRHDFHLRDFEVGWGVGARLHGPTFNALRVEVAHGREGLRLIFAGSQPF
jgi:hypothetical protein